MRSSPRTSFEIVARWLRSACASRLFARCGSRLYSSTTFRKAPGDGSVGADRQFAGAIEFDHARQDEAAARDRDAAELLEQRPLLPDAHERRIRGAQQVADPAQARQPFALAHRVGYVAHQTVDAHHGAGGVAYQAAAVVNPGHGAVRPQHPVLDLERYAFRQQFPCREHRRPVLGVDHVDPQVRIGNEFLSRVPVDRLRRGADVGQAFARHFDRPQHVGHRFVDAVQPLPRFRELFLRLAARATVAGVLQRAFDRRRQAKQIRFQDVIGRAAPERADRVFLADCSGHEQEGNVRMQFVRQRKRGHAVELRHREIGNDEVRRKPPDFEPEFLLGVDQAVFHAHPGAPQLAQLDLGVRGDVFHQQDANAFGQAHGVGACSGTRLVSTQ